MTRTMLAALAALGAVSGCAGPMAARAPGQPMARVMIAFDAHGEIAGRTEGVADPASGRAPTLDDPVRVASVSKMIVAMGVLKLVEEGRLDLDRPVGEYLGYPVRNPHRPGEAVTLRQLLSHRSGLRDHDDQYAIPLGGTVKAVLDDPKSWDSAHGAGWFTYANVNFPVVASVMEQASGERFDRLMQRLVLAPMGLDACFNWPTCSDAAVARAVVLAAPDGAVLKDGLGGRRPDCPVQAAADGTCDLARWRAGENGALFAPQGGLRISANGLARLGRMLLNGGMFEGRRILSAGSVRQLLDSQWAFDGQNGDSEGGFYCRYGLASQQVATPNILCRDTPPGLAGGQWVGHAGEAYGLRSGLWIDPVRRQGFAFYVTGLGAAQRKGKSAFTAAEEAAIADAVALLPQAPAPAL